MPQRPARVQSAILRPGRVQDRVHVSHHEATPDLAALVDYFWSVRWSTPRPHVQEVVPRPVVHVSAEALDGTPRLIVHGVRRRMFRRVLEGEGHTVAIAFRPAGFRPYLGSDLCALVDQELPADRVLDMDDRAVAAAALACARVEDGAAVLAEWLRSLHPVDDPLVSRMAALVEHAEGDSSLVRAEQLADMEGVTLRTLQRYFRAYVGVGPKWVVQRCRLLDVTRAAHTEPDVDWAGLAARLGFADQSHLIRAFTRLVGHPPARYARDA